MHTFVALSEGVWRMKESVTASKVAVVSRARTLLPWPSSVYRGHAGAHQEGLGKLETPTRCSLGAVPLDRVRRT